MRQLSILAIFLASIISLSARANELPLHGKSVVRLATVEEGSKALRSHDRFIEQTSGFERQVRLRTSLDVSIDEYLKFAAAQVLPWDKSSADQLASVLRSIRQRMSLFQLPYPETILLIRTTGREEAGAAYCRGRAMVLPEARLGGSLGRLQRLVTHELFHILSSHNPDLRRRLYAIVGFRPCDPVRLPASLRSRRITNPDAPTNDAYIQLQWRGQTIHAVPILYGSATQYDPRHGKNLFQYVQFRLMVIQPRGTQWEPVLRDDGPWLLRAGDVKDYARQIGENTNYVIHPDEILADNFVHLIFEDRELPSPWLVDDMRQVLTGTSDAESR